MKMNPAQLLAFCNRLELSAFQPTQRIIIENSYVNIHFKALRIILYLIEFIGSVTKHINLTFNSSIQLKLTLYIVLPLTYFIYIFFHCINCANMRSRWYIRNFDDGFCGIERSNVFGMALIEVVLQSFEVKLHYTLMSYPQYACWHVTPTLLTWFSLRLRLPAAQSTSKP